MASGERPRDGRVVAGRRRRDRRQARRRRRGRGHGRRRSLFYCLSRRLSIEVCLNLRSFSGDIRRKTPPETSPRRVPRQVPAASFVLAPAGAGRSRRQGSRHSSRRRMRTQLNYLLVHARGERGFFGDVCLAAVRH